MAKILKHNDAKIGDPTYSFYCPGCKCDHGIWTRMDGWNGATWEFNGDLDKPTISPSILVSYTYGEDHKKIVCHSFVKDGFIQYLSDCTHELAGKTIELENIEL